MKIQRHHLVFLLPHSPFVIHSCHVNNPVITQYVATWINKGLPCVYARQLCHDGFSVNLGLPVLIDNTKYRVGLSIDKNYAAKKQELPKLVTMDHFFCKKLQRQTDTLFSPEELIEFHSISVYGSFLFEYLSEQCVVHNNSDLDLLIEYGNFSLTELNQLLITLKRIFDLPIDGEVRFKDFGDISFNELLTSSAENLLFKTTDKIGLVSRHDLYDEYPDLRRH